MSFDSDPSPVMQEYVLARTDEEKETNLDKKALISARVKFLALILAGLGIIVYPLG